MEQEAHGHISIHQAKQLRTAPKVDASLIGTRIEFLFEFETDTIEEKTLHWCRGKINAISDGTQVVTGKTRQTWKEGEAAEVIWDEISEINMAEHTTREKLDPRKWNKDCLGAWRKDLGEFNYGL